MEEMTALRPGDRFVTVTEGGVAATFTINVDGQPVIDAGQDHKPQGADSYYEFGYRLDGVEVWEEDHGPEGSWIPWRPDLGIDGIDVQGGGTHRTVEEIQGDLWEELAGTGRVAEVIRRKVALSRGLIETVARTDELDEGDEEEGSDD